MRLLLRFVLAFVVALSGWPALAAPAFNPAKAIRLIVPFPAGAGSDAIARLVAQRLGERLGTTVVVDNRAGAGGAIGAVEAAKADADGTTLLFVASPFTTVAAASANAGYDPIKQFTPVAAIAVGPLVFLVHPSVPATTFREFIAYAKAHAGVLNYGSAGNGSINHLALELLKARSHIDVVHVAYKGIAPATTDLLAGEIQSITASVPAALPFIAQNRLRALAVTGDKRLAVLPNVPTWKEEGVDASVVNYWGIVAPADTPREIVLHLHREMSAVLAETQVRERLEREGNELVVGPPARLGELIRADYDRWKRLIQDSGLRLD